MMGGLCKTFLLGGVAVCGSAKVSASADPPPAGTGEGRGSGGEGEDRRPAMAVDTVRRCLVGRPAFC